MGKAAGLALLVVSLGVAHTPNPIKYGWTAAETVEACALGRMLLGALGRAHARLPPQLLEPSPIWHPIWHPMHPASQRLRDANSSRWDW
jgi:hypothetical protein